MLEKCAKGEARKKRENRRGDTPEDKMAWKFPKGVAIEVWPQACRGERGEGLSEGSSSGKFANYDFNRSAIKGKEKEPQRTREICGW